MEKRSSFLRGYIVMQGHPLRRLSGTQAVFNLHCGLASCKMYMTHIFIYINEQCMPSHAQIPLKGRFKVFKMTLHGFNNPQSNLCRARSLSDTKSSTITQSTLVVSKSNWCRYQHLAPTTNRMLKSVLHSIKRGDCILHNLGLRRFSHRRARAAGSPDQFHFADLRVLCGLVWNCFKLAEILAICWI